MNSLVRILLIEDSVEDAELIERTLVRGNGYHYEIKRVDQMAHVIDSINSEQWDILICDYTLPGFDATAVMRFLDEQDIDVPFILVSGSASEEMMQRTIKLGADDYVNKNNLSKLVPVVRRELRISNAYDETLKAFVRALSFRDNETSGHSERVVDLTKALAKKMGLLETVIIHIGRGALLHDIGKMGIPDSVLLKKGPLTPDERLRMEFHPVIGKDLLSQIPFLKKAIEIPLYHHERWNGSGYPFGMSGNEIPLSARIFAVVDVYDAMTSERSYRVALTKQFVLDYILAQSGILFDPEVVKSFIELMEDDHE